MKTPPYEGSLTKEQAKEILKTAYLHLEPPKALHWRLLRRHPANRVEAAIIGNDNPWRVLHASYEPSSHHSEETIPTPKTSDGKAKFVEATLDPNQLSLNRISKIIAAWKQQNKTLFQHISVFVRCSGDTIPCCVDPAWRIGACTPPGADCVLMCNGRILHPLQSFAEASIESEMTIDCFHRLRGGSSRIVTDDELEMMMGISVSDICSQSAETRQIPFYAYPSSARSDTRRRKMVQHLYRLKYAVQKSLLQYPSQPNASTENRTDDAATSEKGFNRRFASNEEARNYARFSTGRAFPHRFASRGGCYYKCMQPGCRAARYVASVQGVHTVSGTVDHNHDNVAIGKKQVPV